jgi:recombination protein RecA
VLDVALEKKIVQKAGSYFSFGDERLGQGRQNASAFLAENPDIVQQILARIQAEAPEEQVISARLLPAVSPAERAVPPSEKPLDVDATVGVES